MPIPASPVDDDHATVALRGRRVRLGQRRQRSVALEQLHGPTIDLPWSCVSYAAAAARSSSSISILPIFSIAAITRCAFSWSGSAISSFKRVGTICQETP